MAQYFIKITWDNLRETIRELYRYGYRYCGDVESCSDAIKYMSARMVEPICYIYVLPEVGEMDFTQTISGYYLNPRIVTTEYIRKKFARMRWVVLNDEHSALVSKRKIIVGCQEFKISVLRKLLAAHREISRANIKIKSRKRG
jgi:hypothetical protein